METSVGPVVVGLVGPEGGGSFLALGGMGQRGCGTAWELAGVTTHLASTPKNPYRVILPDPFSNPSTPPSAGEFAIALTVTTFFGMWRGDCREKWLLDLLPKPEEGKPVVLAGHSWGGGAAARLAAAYPEAVSRLVLVSPDVEWSVAQSCFNTPTLIIWAKDDWVNPIIWACRWRGHPKLTIVPTETGGHMLQASHAEIISQWLEEQDVVTATCRANNDT